MSSMAVKRRPFTVLFIFGNRKKSHGAMSGEYGSWGMYCKAMNCFSTNSGVFLGLLHANGVELVGSTPY